MRHTMNLSDRDDRIGAGGITATQLQADAARTHQQAVDAKLAEWFQRETGTYDTDGLLKLHNDRRAQ
jgi:hypothetical protein